LTSRASVSFPKEPLLSTTRQVLIGVCARSPCRSHLLPVYAASSSCCGPSWCRALRCASRRHRINSRAFASVRTWRSSYPNTDLAAGLAPHGGLRPRLAGLQVDLSIFSLARLGPNPACPRTLLDRDGNGQGRVRVNHLPTRWHTCLSLVYPYPSNVTGKNPYPYPQGTHRVIGYPQGMNINMSISSYPRLQ
jgi:hypothetical protein